MRSDHSTSDAVIAGGGFAGLVSALAIARSGLRVTVLESLPGPIAALRGELIHPPGVRLLESLGAADFLRARDAVDLRGFAAFQKAGAEPVELPYSRGRGLGLEHARIVEGLRHAVAAAPRVRLLTGARVDGVLTERRRIVGVRCQGHGEVRAPVVIAADGRHSRLRQALGIAAKASLLSYTLGIPVPRRALPRPDLGHVFLGAPGPILAYPLGSAQARMNVDVPLRAPRGRDELVAWLREEYPAFLPAPLREAFLQAVSAGPFLACATHAITTSVCAVRGAALVGDAGGCSHPLTATGMTSALHDAVALADCLQADGPGDEALLAYQRRRYRFVRERESFAQALYDVFRGGDAGARAIREAVFRYWEDEGARRASTDILAGESPGALVFAREYAHVVALALQGAGDRAAVLSSAAGSLRTTAWNEVSSRLAARTPWLRPLDQASPRLSETEVPASADPSSRTAARRTSG